MAKTSKHQYLLKTLRSEIQKLYKPGDQLPSDRALAVRFDVSNVTIRNAMTTLAHESLVERHVGRGTHVLDNKKQQHVGLLLQSHVFDPGASTFGLTAIRHVIGRLVRQQIPYRLYLAQNPMPNHTNATDDHVEAKPTYPLLGLDFLEAIASDKLRGLLVFDLGPHPQWTNPLLKKGVPLVGLHREFEHRVQMDSTAAIHRAVQYLLGHGRRKLAYIGWDNRNQWENGKKPDDMRKLAFITACERAGIKPVSGWIDTNVDPSHPGEGWESFRAIWSARRQVQPDGLVVVDDRIFRDVSIAISNMGLVIPDQLMIVTHANRYSGMVAPFPVARMEIDPTEVAEQACNMLLALMAGEKLTKNPVMIESVWRDEILLTPDALRLEYAIVRPN